MGIGPIFVFATYAAFVCVVALIAYDIGRRKGHSDSAPEVERADRYGRAVDDLDKWCGHESPQARLIAQHLRAEGKGLPMNAGTPFGNEPCVISGLREQLRRLTPNATLKGAGIGPSPVEAPVGRNSGLLKES